MIFGQVRDGFPHVLIDLPGRDGGTVRVEFIVDTGFDGALAVPEAFLPGLDVQYDSSQRVALADGTLQDRPLLSNQHSFFR